MTRAQQNTLILASIGDKLKDTPNVQEIIGNLFSVWFKGLVATGIEMTQPQVAAPAAGGGGEEAGAPAPQEG
jgi:hypothetical protein